MRVLFIGNSHTYFNDMPETFAKMCRKLTGKRPEVTMIAYSERSLDWHLKEYFAIRYAILYGKFDYCVIQQQAHPFPDPEETWKAVKRITDLCGTRNVMPVLFMTWAEKAKPENAPLMSRCYRRLARRHHALLAPIGELFQQFRGTDIELYWQDGEHASPYGSYLTAAALAALLAGADKLDLLSDRGCDFAVCFEGEDGLPAAETDPERCEIALDGEKTARLRAAVKALL